MKIIIFGATGGTGQHLVNQSLEQGHDVTAFVRNPEKMKQSHIKLSLIKGSVLDKLSVKNAIQNHDVVLCAIGTPATDKTGLRAHGIKSIIQAMQASSVSRLICQSGLGCGESFNILPFYYKYLIFPIMLRHVFADHENQEKLIRESQLDWIIVRPASLNNGALTKSYQQGFSKMSKTMKIKISRADTADFMLKQLTDNLYLHKAASISY